MRSEFGYAEEDQLGKPYNFRLLKRLYPYTKSYLGLFIVSVCLILMMTALDISLPYVTKIAIDRYIVPGPHQSTRNQDHDNDLVRYYQIRPRDEKTAAILSKYSDRYPTWKTDGVIPYEMLRKLEKEDLASLRVHDVKGLGISAVILLGIAAASFALNYFQVQLMEYIGQMIMHALRMNLFIKILNQTVSFFSSNPVGRLVTRSTNDIQNMHELFTSVIVVVFKDFFLLIGIAVVLIAINWQLAMISFSVIPLVVFASFKFSNLARDAFRVLRIKLAEINTHFSESIAGVKILQIFSHEKENSRRFERLNHEYYVAGMQQIQVFAVFMPVIELLAAVAVGMIIYYGGGSALDGKISLGALVAFISYMRMFFNPIRDVAEKYNIMQNAMASAERIFLILDRTDSEQAFSEEDTIPSPPGLMISKVSFKNVSFHYVKGESVLENVSFEVNKGETLAIVGPTGSGKTSLIHLIPRFYDPDSGMIQVNDQNIKTFNLFQLRSRIALVTQDPFLFSGTVHENIFWNSDHSAKIHFDEILELSQCREWIERLPHGMKTRLTEGGKSLSSGERQLISIARAFAFNPDLVILDEATSYVDSRTENRIQLALSNLMAQKTCIIIAHRLFTARKANQILVLNKGRIVEKGTHESLMKERRYYFRLYQLQNPEAAIS